MMEEKVELYRRFPPPSRSILVVLDPFPVEVSIPEDKEVYGAFYHLHLNSDGSTSGMKAEYIWYWLRRATR